MRAEGPEPPGRIEGGVEIREVVVFIQEPTAAPDRAQALRTHSRDRELVTPSWGEVVVVRRRLEP